MIKQIQEKFFLKSKYKSDNDKINPILFLIFCLILGTILRFSLLTSKPIWTDEFATLVFSLGNSYNSVPLNELITINQLLEPLQYNYDTNIHKIASLLINEDNHPPLYFMLANLWNKLFSNQNIYVSLWVARGLPALLGVLSIPAIYYLTKIAFLSQKTAYLATWLMTVSPYGIYLAQEARHYTLGILFVIASLGCLVTVIKSISQGKIISLWLLFAWTVVNILGFLTHYFFLITLVSEGVALIFYFVRLTRNKQIRIFNKTKLIRENLMRLFGATTLIFAVISYWFLAIIPHNHGKGMTAWIETNKSSFLGFISPIFQLLATGITMISLLPVESNFLPIIIISGLIMTLFFIWLLPQVFRGIKLTLKIEQLNIIKTLLVFYLTTISIFFLTTYLLNMDITRGARYSFVYFPVVILLVAVALTNMQIFSQNKSLLILGIMGLLSAITVTTNLGYQKYYRPDLLIPIIKANSTQNIVIATTHKTLVETGEMMSIAWELKKHNNLPPIKFLLVHQNYENDPNSTLILQQAINKMDSTLDLWLVNFHGDIKLDNCFLNSQTKPHIDGYNYQLYKCFNQ